MNENSPTCARSIPAVTATRMVVAATRNAPVATDAFTKTSRTAIAMMTGNCPTRIEGSDQHPERDEEQPREDVAKGTNLGVRLMAVLALREDEAAEKRAERHRDAEERAGPRRADAREQHRQRKRLPPPASRHEPEEHRQHEPADDGHDADGRRGRREHFGYYGEGRSARQDRDEQEQPDDAEVLEEHDAHDESPVWGVELIRRAQFLEHDSGARERNEEACEEAQAPGRHRAREREDEDEDRRRGCADLQRPADQHLPPDPADLGKRELEADREEQQHDAHLGQQLDIVLRLDDAHACRAGDRAGDDERDDRGDSDAAEDQDEDQCNRVGQHQFGQGRVRGHASV